MFCRDGDSSAHRLHLSGGKNRAVQKFSIEELPSGKIARLQF
jgi:hypothetical protein